MTTSTTPSPFKLPSIPTRPDTYPSTMGPPAVPARKRRIAPAGSASPFPASSSNSPDPSEQEEDEEYSPKAPAKRQRVTKPAAVPAAKSKNMSREQLRKANHSLIERRRREKINAALDSLREMVPGLGVEQGKGGEFKLEVLERTVEHMQELKKTIKELESRVERLNAPSSSTVPKPCSSISTSSTSSPDVPPRKLDRRPFLVPKSKSSSKGTPPSPSLSPDANETEPEANLPPPYTIARSLVERHQQPTRPMPSSHAANPTLYLPFPTPSPTSPFLTYQSSSANSSGITEPSPFIAPLNNISLFGGALNLDSSHKGSMQAEEAANVLLAFSSPDVMRPSMGLTPKMVPVGERLDDEFVLDGGVAVRSVKVAPGESVVGKTARDILRM